MKRTIKTILLFSLAIFMMTGVCGCMNNKLSTGHQKMMDYINAKYSDEFVYIKAKPTQFGSRYHSILVLSNTYQQSYVTVFCWETSEGTLYGDNYLNIKFEKETKELIETIVAGIGDDSWVFYQPFVYGFDKDATEETLFADYVQNPSFGIVFTAIINNTDDTLNRDQILECLKKMLEETNLCCSGSIHFVRNADMVTINEKNYSNILHSNVLQTSLVFQMKQKGTINSYRWDDK